MIVANLCIYMANLKQAVERKNRKEERKGEKKRKISFKILFLTR